MAADHKRWLATIHYRAEAGMVDVPHAIEELDELADIVEGGPDWNTVDRIEIRLAHPSPAGLTIEAAERL